MNMTLANSMIPCLLMLLCIGQVYSSAAGNGLYKEPLTKQLPKCSKNIWEINSIDEDAGIWHGNTMLEFYLPLPDKVSKRWEAILACEGLAINGTGRQILKVKMDEIKKVQFRLHIPVPKDAKEIQYNAKDLNHSCTYELRDVTKTPGIKKNPNIQCEFMVRTVENRILPSCNYERNKELIEDIKVIRERGQVNIYTKFSANDVITTNHECYVQNLLGHNRDANMASSLFPLRPPGSNKIVKTVQFIPPCDTMNASMRDYYTNHRMDDCHLEVYALCQEGKVQIKEMTIAFDDDMMYCHPPKPAYMEMLENLEMHFRIESIPITILLSLLIVNGGLYFILVPFAIIKFYKYVKAKLQILKEKQSITKVNKPQPPEPKPRSPEYNEVELSLFDKLSSEDFRQPANGDDSPAIKTIHTQVEVHCDTEVVDTQPQPEEEPLDGYADARQRKSHKLSTHNKKVGKDHKKKEKATKTPEHIMSEETLEDIYATIDFNDHKKSTKKPKNMKSEDLDFGLDDMYTTVNSKSPMAGRPLPPLPSFSPPPPLPGNK